MDGPDVWWSEGRPTEGGRTQLVRRAAGEEPQDVLPEGWNARTQVHEYGGGAWTVRDGVLWFSAWADQRIYRLDVGAGQAVPQPVTPNPIEPRALRYADADLSPDGAWLVCVRERHGAGAEAVNEIVALPASPGEDVGEPVEPVVLVTGPDFVSSPRISPDGSRLAWIQWDHPNMPWDGTELCWAPFDSEGGAADAERVAGGPAESVIQPTWTAGGGLLASSDRTGWWNVYRFTGSDLVLDEPEALTPIDAEVGGPHWVFGQSWFAVLPDDTLVVSLGAEGLQAVGVVAPGTGRVERLETPYTAVGQLRAVGAAEFAMVAAGPAHESTPLRCRFAAEGALETEVLRPARDLGFDPATFSAPEPVEFPTSGGRTAHALLYRPTNPEVVGPPRGAAAAARAEPRRSHLRRPPDPQPRHPVLDQPGLRGRRRQLRRQHRLRPPVPGAAERHVGRRRRGRLRGRGRAPGRRGHRRPGAARDPGRERRRVHDALRARLPRHLRRRGEPLRRGRLRGARPGHPQVRVPLPRRPDRALPGRGRASTGSARRSTTRTGSPAR